MILHYLKFPEIADAILLDHERRKDGRRGSAATVEGAEFQALMIRADSSFFRMFGVSIIEGSREFLIPDSRKIAITQDKAKQLFGKGNPIGKSVEMNGKHEICAIVILSYHATLVGTVCEADHHPCMDLLVYPCRSGIGNCPLRRLAGLQIKRRKPG